MTARRLGLHGRFPPRALLVSGPYASGDPHAATVLTQVHCHTTGSDGSYSPATVVADYLAAGYGALAITDHDVVTSQPAGITTAITSNEHSPTTQHIIALDSDWTRGSETAAQAILDGIAADGGLAELAHPNWGIGLTYGEMAALTDYAGIEIHNAKVVSPGAGGYDPAVYPGFAIDRWDELLAGRRDVWGFAVDDLHAIDAFGAHDVGRLQVFVASNTKANIMAAIAGGNFAADVSNHGVTPGFPVRTAADLSLACTGATRIEAYGPAGYLDGTSGTSHTHVFDGSQAYVRLVAVGGYSEGFASALSDRWYAVDGTWNVSGGTLAVSSDVTARRIVLRRHRLGAFTAQVDIKLGSGGTDAGALLWNVLDSDHYYMVRIGESTLSSYNNFLTVAKTTTNAFSDGSELDSAAFDPVAGTWYTVKLDVTAAGRIRAKVFERATSEPDWMVDVTDATWAYGAFGLRANRATEFDNLVIDGFRTYYQPVAIDT